MSSKFLEHGSFEMGIVGRLLVSEIQGPWNAELSERFWVRFLKMMVELDVGGPWGSITTTHGSAILSPEGFARYKARVHDVSGGSKRVAAAIVMNDQVEGYGLVNELYEEVFRGVCAMRIFDTYAEGEAWVLAEVGRAARGNADALPPALP